jgi:hypothetical protein
MRQERAVSSAAITRGEHYPVGKNGLWIELVPMRLRVPSSTNRVRGHQLSIECS